MAKRIVSHVNGEQISSGLRARRIQKASAVLNKYSSSENIRIRRVKRKAFILGFQEVASTLIKALSSKEVQVRANAALELGRLGTVRGIPVLCEVLSTDRDPTVRLNAAKALGMIGKQEPVVRNSVN